jgi:phytol kinase
MTQWLWLFFFLCLLLMLIIVSEILYRRFHWPTERSRKFLHVSGGLMCLLFPSIFTSHWYVLGLAVAALMLLLITYSRKLLPSVHQTKRNSVGSVLFPIPVYGCFLLSEIYNDDLLFYLPVALLAISDTAAEIGGNRWGHLGKQFFNGQKTLAGSICYFITAIVVCFCLLYFAYDLSLGRSVLKAFLISLLTCIAELVTLHGWDNLTVPATSLMILMLC